MSSDRYNAIKRKLAAQSIPATTQTKAVNRSATGRSERFEKIREKLSSGGFSTSMTADDVDSFLYDSQSFMERSANAYSGLTWEQATSEEYKSKRKETSADLSSRAGQVRTFLNAKKANLDPQIYENYMQYLDDFSEFQAKSAASFDEAYGNYAGFESQEAYDQALSEGIQQAEWQKKYEGMSQVELQNAIADLEDGAEKDWATDYAYSTMTRLDLTKAVQSKKGELGMLIALQDEDRNLTKQLQVLATNSEEAKRATARKAEIYQQFGDLDGRIEATRAELWKLEREEKYKALSENPDYASKSVELNNRPFTSYLPSNPDEASDHLLIMTDSELANFYYLVNTSGVAAAHEYLGYLNYDLDERRKARLAAKAQKLATEHPVWADITSVGHTLMSGIGLLDVAGQKVAKDLSEAFTGEYAGPINYKGSAMNHNTIATSIRSTRAQNIADKYGVIDIDGEKHPRLSRILNGKSWGDVYQLGMSMADSVAVMAMGLINPALGTVGTVLLGSAAGTQAMLNAVEKGATDEQAIQTGILSAAFEMLFEKYELDRLLGQGDNFWKALWRQSLSEATGESATEAANILADIAVMAEKSDYKQNILRYLAENPTWDYRKAEQQAFIDAALQVTESGAGGLISGGFMGGGATVVSNSAQQYQYYKTGKTIRKNGGMDALMNLTDEVKSKTTADMQAAIDKQRSKVSKKATSTRIGKLYDTVTTANNRANASANKADIAKSLMRNNFSEQKANDIAEALISRYNGQELTDAQNRLLRSVNNSAAVQNVIANIMANPNSTMGQRSQNIRNFQRDVEIGRIARETGISAETVKAILNDDLADTSEKVPEISYEVSTEGKATQISTGQAISVQRIASIKNGEMTFWTKDGAKIDAKDISFDSEHEADVYAAVAKLNNNAKVANLLVNAYHMEPMDGIDFAQGIREAYQYGKFNISQNEMQKYGSYAMKLSNHQRELAYDLGQLFSGKQVSREVAAIRRRKKIGRKDEGAVHFDGDRSKLNDTQRAGLDAMELLAKVLGIQFYVFESEVDADGNHIGENGLYDPEDGSIHIDLHAGTDGKGTILFTVAHELTHYIRQWSPVKFKILANYLMEQYGKQGVLVNELIDDQIAKAKRANRTIDRDEAFEEVVADSMETMLNSGRVLQCLADIRKQDRTLAEKIQNWFKDFAEKLKGIVSTYKNVNPDSVEGRLVADMKDVISTFESLYGDGLLDASENFDAEAQKNTAEGGVKYSIREDIVDVNGKEYISVVELDKTVSKRTLSEPKKFLNYIEENLVGLKVPVDDGYGNTEIIEFARINETVTKNRKRHPVLGKLAYTKGETRKQVIVNAAEVIQVSTYDPEYSSAANEHGWLDENGWKSRKTYVLTQDGMIYEAYLKIAKTRDGRNILYAVNLDVNKGIAVDQGATSKKAAVLAAMPSGDMLAHDSTGVNKKFSARDSTGKQLSEGQRKYFKDSQCRDREGNLLALYHQTDGVFTIFDARHPGAGSNDGGTPFGIFLKRSAGDIGLAGKKQMVLYANITNPLRAANREDLARQLCEISGRYAAISDKHKQLDAEYQRKIDQAQVAWNDYVKQWRKSNPDAKRTEIYEDPKFNELDNAEDDLVEEWETASDQLSVQAKEAITEDLRKAGYDGIFLEEDAGSWGRHTDAIIALDANQVKNTDNRNPTNDPDIRHSSRDPAQRKIREALEQENAQLKEDVARLEELVKLQRTGTGGAKFTKTSVEAAARMLKKYANAKRMANTGELAQLLHTFYEYIATESELTWEKVREQAQPAVRWLQEHVDLKEERSEYAQTILNQMKGIRIYLDENQRAEAAYRFGSYNDFRKALFGKLTFVNEGNTSLDSWWQSMADQFPDVFHPDTSSTDMPGELFDIIEQLRNADNSRVEYEYNRASISVDLTRQVYDSYWRVSTLYTVADRAQQKIDRLKSNHYQQMNKLRAEQNAKIDQLKEEHREDLQQVSENRRRTEVRRKILRVTDELNRLLLRDDKKHHVPDSMKKAVASAMELLEIDPVNAVERIAKLDMLIYQATDPDIIDSLMASRDRIREQAGNIGAKLRELHTAYAEIMDSSDPDIAAGYDPVIDGNIRELSKTIGDTPFSKLSLEQLEDVYSMYKMVLTRVRDANQSLVLGRKANVSERASRVSREILRVGGEHTHRVAILDPVRKFRWDNLKPVFAFERLGSATLTEAYDDVRKGEETWIKDVFEAKQFYRKQARKHGYDSWDFKKTYRFKSVSGLEFGLTLEQIMSLYAYSKRKQAHEHLRVGGFVFDSNIETYKKKDGKKSILKYKVNTADAHQITPDILAGIIDNLSAEQRAFVDEMQEYLSSTMGAKGNEVSMKMYGVKLFKEKFYFPLKSAKQFLFEQNEVAGEVRIKSSGFTNKAVPKANNPIILNNFMDVWAGHVNDMSMYHSFVLPLEDFNRIFNYNSPKKEGQPPVSVKGTIQSAYTPAAVDYVKQLITDLNGGAVSDPRETFAKVMTSKYKKAKVMASLSVIIQQPSAIGRAFALINPAYFKPTIDGMNHSQLWEEVKKYAPVAIIKEMGYFDTGMGRSTIDFIQGKEYSGIKEKAKAIVTDSNYRDELLAKGPALADELTWCAIWNAVKRETKATHKELSPSSEAFLKAAGERFTEVVTKTQMYDSVLARSAHMRSKSGLMNMATSFMAEPTTAINMIEDAILKAKRGYKGYAAREVASVAVSIVLNNVLVALVYAMRDDDEDETYAEKYMQSFVSNMLDDINPVTYYPFLKDMWSLMQGFDVKRADMSLIGDLADAMKRLTKAYTSEDGDVAGAWWDIADSVVNLTGFPLQNIRRDVVGAMNLKNTIIEDIRNRDTTWGSMGDALESAVRDSLPVLGWLSGETKADKLYGAIINGDTAYEERLKKSYVDKDGNFNKTAFRSAIRKGLRNNDPRIKKAAQARLKGDYTTANNLLNQIAAEGCFSRSDIAAAIKAEYNHLKED